jgi:hypothetical protein
MRREMGMEMERNQEIALCNHQRRPEKKTMKTMNEEPDDEEDGEGGEVDYQKIAPVQKTITSSGRRRSRSRRRR